MKQLTVVSGVPAHGGNRDEIALFNGDDTPFGGGGGGNYVGHFLTKDELDAVDTTPLLNGALATVGDDGSTHFLYVLSGDAGYWLSLATDLVADMLGPRLYGFQAFWGSVPNLESLPGGSQAWAPPGAPATPEGLLPWGMVAGGSVVYVQSEEAWYHYPQGLGLNPGAPAYGWEVLGAPSDTRRVVMPVDNQVVNAAATQVAPQMLGTTPFTLTSPRIVHVGAAVRFSVAGASAPVDVSTGILLRRLEDDMEFIQGDMNSTGWGGTAAGEAISDGGPGHTWSAPLVDGDYELSLLAWRSDEGAENGVVTIIHGEAIAAIL